MKIDTDHNPLHFTFEVDYSGCGLIDTFSSENS